ncbi:MAG: hypothetical protein ABWJ97_05690 [Thermoproteus sp.]
MDVYGGRECLWIDRPPGRGFELGVGEHFAWPLYKEAVGRALGLFRA